MATNWHLLLIPFPLFVQSFPITYLNSSKSFVLFGFLSEDILVIASDLRYSIKATYASHPVYSHWLANPLPVLAFSPLFMYLVN